MIDPNTMAIVFGLSSALAWGAGDFAGGIASRRGSVLTVVFFSQMVGGLLMLGLAMLSADRMPDSRQVLPGLLAGACAVVGLVGLYKGMAAGRMGLVAPLSAVFTVVIPIVYSFLTEGIPRPLRILGLAAAMAAVWLLASPSGALRIKKGELRLSLLAGLGFGMFFILMDHAGGQTVLWPVLAAKAGAVLVMLPVMMATRQVVALSTRQAPFIILAGILDTAGTAAFAVAGQLGRLDIAIVLASLYPAATILLAWLVFRERLDRRQWLGVAVAGGALVCIAL